jgi:hypothetical protein
MEDCHQRIRFDSRDRPYNSDRSNQPPGRAARARQRHPSTSPTGEPPSRRGAARPRSKPRTPESGGSSHLGGRMMKLTSWSIGGRGGDGDSGRRRRSKQACSALTLSDRFRFPPPLLRLPTAGFLICFGCGEHGGGLVVASCLAFA